MHFLIGRCREWRDEPMLAARAYKSSLALQDDYQPAKDALAALE